MQPMINLVATRLKSGKPAELLRWYNDHVNILMRCEDLNGASLYRCTSAEQAATPEYVCLYDFSSPDAFAAFEASKAKEWARQVTETGWGKQGIEIIKRTQYVTGCKWSGQAVDSASLVSSALSPLESGFHIQCLDMASNPDKAAHEADDLKRWMADSLYAAAAQSNVKHYEWYTSGSQQPSSQQGMVQAIVVAGYGSATTKSEGTWRSWWDMPTTEPLGQAPGEVQVKWQASYERVSVWRR